jgi:hypothetical protein
MYFALHGLLIGFLGMGMYAFVDRLEPNRKLAQLLKALVVLTAALALFHKLQ